MERIADVASRRAKPGAGVTATLGTDGRVALRKPKFGPAGTRVLRWFRVAPDLTVHLDALGSAAWSLLEGRTLGQVRKELEAQFPGERDIGARLGKFVGTMVSRGLVTLE